MEYTPLASLEEANNKLLPGIHHHMLQNLSQIAKTLVLYNNKESIPLLAHIMAQLADEETTAQ